MKRARAAVRRSTTGMRQDFRRTRAEGSKFADEIRSMKSLLRAGIFVAAVTGLTRSLTDAITEAEKFKNVFRAAAGSQEAAAREMEFVREEAKRLGLDLRSAANDYSRLLASVRQTPLEGAPAREIFLAVAEASTVMGLSAEDTSGAMRALEHPTELSTLSPRREQGAERTL